MSVGITLEEYEAEHEEYQQRIAELEKDQQKLVYAFREGGAFDRGAADAYFGRRSEPHYYKGSLRVSIGDMTTEEVELYLLGYAEQTKARLADLV